MNRLKILGIFALIVSCSTEKISSVSAYGMSSNLINQNNSAKNTEVFSDKIGKESYTSELTTHISSFPKFQNLSLNKEVDSLKFHIKEYIYAVQAYNLVGQDKALLNIEKSYRKIQKLRKSLDTKDDETINVYMVRIKNSISRLENIKKDSIKG